MPSRIVVLGLLGLGVAVGCSSAQPAIATKDGGGRDASDAGAGGTGDHDAGPGVSTGGADGASGGTDATAGSGDGSPSGDDAGAAGDGSPGGGLDATMAGQDSSPGDGQDSSPGTADTSTGSPHDSSTGGTDAPTTITGGDGGTFPTAGNPTGSCMAIALPTAAQLVDTSSPTTVVGTGTVASCTFAALANAVSKGGVVTFACGPSPVTIPVTATLTPPTSNAYAKQPSVSTVIDGGDKVTLDGQGAVRIMSWVHQGSWRVNQDTLTLQRIRMINGKATPVEAIPACPAANGISNMACSTGYDDGQGGALLVQDGNLRVIGCIFDGNQAALLGPDTGGGALYLYGTGNPAYIAQSSFLNNMASNAGGVGMLWAGAFIFDSLFEGNRAVGTGANDVDATMCTCSNMGNANQIGSGGNGGAIYKDGGDGVNVTICGTLIQGNTSNEFGPAVFLTADGSAAELVIDDSTLTENTAMNPVWQWCPGVSTDNPHGASSSTGSPSPIQTTFCDASGGNCTMTCGS